MSIKCPKCNTDNPDTVKFCGECGTLLRSVRGTDPTDAGPDPRSDHPKDAGPDPRSGRPFEDIPVRTETMEAPKKELTTGSTFAGRYQIIEQLGQGGMGKVYKVLDKEVNAKIALKLIKPEIASDKKTIERFRNELKVARDIAHKNVCRMYDLGKEEGAYYITMEYVSGEDLKSFIRRAGYLSPGKAITIANQVCEGLTEAHRLGVIHRDLKPQNIMIDKEGNARIMDFGIARSLRAKGITGSGVMIGTPEYMSPEQVEGKEADHRADIYSLGVILYEMVTGRVPFEGDTPFSIGVKQKSEIPRPPKEVNVQTPEGLNRVILKCMEKEREKRYQSVGELHSELMKLEKDIPTTEKIIAEGKLKTEKIDVKKWKRPLLYGGAAVILILLIIGGISLFTGRQEPIDSIAVLPLENLSGNPEQEYFSDGMTDALISNLAKIGGLKVISRTSVMQYKGKEKSLPDIARELNVKAVVEGSVLSHGQRVRISAQLIESKTDRHIWTNSYERDFRDILVLQNEIAKAIAQEIQVKLTPQEEKRLDAASQVRPEAYQAYLRGRFFWNKRSEEGLNKAVGYFKEAIEKDPNFSLSYVGLADSYNVLPDYSPIPSNEAYLKAKEAALKALEIDPALAEAHASMAFIVRDYEQDLESAEREFKHAIELNPGYATAHHWYAFLLMYLGRHDESIQEIELARDLDPLSLIINANVGFMLYFAGRYDEALAQYKNAMEIAPDFAELHWYIGMAYEQKGMLDEAEKEFDLAIELSGGFTKYIAALGHAYAMAGKKEKALKVIDELRELSEREYISPYNMASIYDALGEKDRAFEWLEKAYEINESAVLYLKVDPLFRKIRPDPRFNVLLKKVGLE
jgi:serine/threonine protein kinase/tetratricopeptide (TPR) repeat protein